MVSGWELGRGTGEYAKRMENRKTAILLGLKSTKKAQSPARGAKRSSRNRNRDCSDSKKLAREPCQGRRACDVRLCASTRMLHEHGNMRELSFLTPLRKIFFTIKRMIRTTDSMSPCQIPIRKCLTLRNATALKHCWLANIDGALHETQESCGKKQVPKQTSDCHKSPVSVFWD